MINKNQKGSSAIEFAIILPILLLIVFGIIEFGWYFLKSQVAARSVSIASSNAQDSPGDPNGKQNALDSGTKLISFGQGGNFICSMSYVNQLAANSGQCKDGDWKTSAPAGVNNNTIYYVAVRAEVPYVPLTPFGSLLKNFNLSTAVQSVVVPVKVNKIPICAPGAYLTSTDGQTFTCVTPETVNTIDADTCNIKTATSFGGAVTCASDEIAMSGGGNAEVPGSGVCGSTSKGFLHSAYPSNVSGRPTPNRWNANAYSDNWTGEACSVAYAVCCKLVSVNKP